MGEFIYQKKLPRKFSPCNRTMYDSPGICGSETCVAKVLMSPRHIALYCGNGHQRTTQWIGHEKFLPGGEYEDAEIPLEYLSQRVTKKRASEFRPSEPVKMRAYHHGRCFICLAPPLKKFSDKLTARWLSKYDLPLFRRLCAAAGRMITDTDIEERWRTEVGEALYREAIDRVRDSMLEMDHLFPVAILVSVREAAPPRAFHDGAKNLIVPLCAVCNRGRKAIVLEDVATLEDRLIDFMFEGKPVLAKGQRIFESFKTLLGPCDEVAGRVRRAKRSTA
jgi:hypothetical protein